MKEQALITNLHLRDSQLAYLNQVEGLQTYQSQDKSLLAEVTQQEEVHNKVEVALHQISRFQKANTVPPPGIMKLAKYEILKYRYTIESWKSKADVVKSSLEKVRDLIERVWNTYSDILDEWGIDKTEESLEALTPRTEEVEHVRASSEEEIKNLVVLDSEMMDFSIISPARMAARVEENAQIAKIGIKEIAALTIQSHLRMQPTKGLEAEELVELNDKWSNWERSLGKALGL